MSVSVSLVKTLRAQTSAGVLDCRKALDACEGDLAASVDWLRQKGLSDAAKKSGRVAAEGLVGLWENGREGVLVEVNAETDFVARGTEFQALVAEVVDAARQKGPELEKILAACASEGSPGIAERIQETIAKVGENLVLRRADRLEAGSGRIVSYLHNVAGPGLGRIGVLVAVESEAEDGQALSLLGRQLAMHVAASQPLAVEASGMDAGVLEQERKIYEEQAADSGKPPNVVEKMVEGRIRKFLQASCLLQQDFVIDPEVTVGAALERASGELGAPVRVSGFRRFAVGEGVEKDRSDFAAEVAAITGS